jgi:hypothetical protein
MKLEAITDPETLENVYNHKRREPVVMNLVREFYNGPYGVCKVNPEGKQYKSPNSMQAALQMVIKRLNYKPLVGTRMVKRGGVPVQKDLHETP